MSMDSKKKTKSKIQSAVIVRTLIPMLLMGIIIAISTYVGAKASVRKETMTSMEGVAKAVESAYNEMMPGDYAINTDGYIVFTKGDKDITYNYNIIDNIHNSTGMEISIVSIDARILTTFKDAYGGRNNLSGVNASIVSKAKKSKDFQTYTVDGAEKGTKYYACYLPLYNSDESYVGLIEVATPVKDINDEAFKTSMPVITITIIALILTFLVIYNYTKSIVGSIDTVDYFLKGMANGKLNNEMKRDVLKRQDELGHVGKTVVDMQNAIRVLVERDPLTNLYNRRYGNAKLRSVLKYAKSSGMPFAVGLGDIDFFKKVNDTYGHDAGDVVLKRVSEILKKSMSGKGFVVRWGGEEFLIVFDKYGQDDAEEMLWTILDKIRAMEIIYKEKNIKVTMTFGIVDGSLSDEYGALINRADERLYYGKENGRNRVVAKDEKYYKEDNKENNNANDVYEDKDRRPAKDAQKDENNKVATTVGFDSKKSGSYVEKMLEKMSNNILNEAEEEAEKMYDKMADNE